MIKHSAIIPLIGGELLGSIDAFGNDPEYILSYEAFWANDRHIVNRLSNVPYIVLDKGGSLPSRKVDVVSSVCPCAGLSMLSHGYGDHNQNNRWMIESTEYVLSNVRPKVLWGENSPHFAGKIGNTVRNELREIGKKYGYTMSVYRTKSILHGIPQVRERSFYFFWKDSRTPILGYYKREYQKIEDLLTSVKSNFQTDVINKKTPSKDDPYYRFILEEMFGGISHREFSEKYMIELEVRSNDVQSFIENAGIRYETVSKFFKKIGFDEEAKRGLKKQEKLDAGGNIMRRGTIVPKDHIGAFVGHYPNMLTHPLEDRYINYREAMTSMGLPQDFELLDPRKSTNHICQNVPVGTARDMATEISKYLDGKLEYASTDYLFQYNQGQKMIFGDNMKSTKSRELDLS